MKVLKHPKVNALFITIISALYAFIFIFTSKHMEFDRIISHSNTLDSGFWNSWSYFAKNGNMKYIGYIIVILTATIILLTVFKRQKYDEYQVNIFAKGLIAAGVITVLMMPIALLLVLSDKNYVIEIMFLLLTVQWLGVLIVDLIYTVKYFK